MHPQDPRGGRGDRRGPARPAPRGPAGPPPVRPGQVPADQAHTVEAAQFHRPSPPPPPAGQQQPHPGWGTPPATPAYPQQAPQAPPAPAGLSRRPLILGAVAAVVVAAGAGGYFYLHRGASTASTASSATTSAAPEGSQVPAAPVTTLPGGPSDTATAGPPPPPAPPPPPPAPAPVLAADALPALLLPADQVGQLLAAPGMTASAAESKPLAGQIAPAQCDGVWGPAYENTLDGSGYTGLAVQGVFDRPTTLVAQAAIAFPDPPAAKAFFDRQSGFWNACKSSRVTWSYQGKSNSVDAAVPALAGDVLSLVITPVDATVAGQRCERDMTVRGNVVVDVRACSPTLTDGGRAITTTIADKVR